MSKCQNICIKNQDIYLFKSSSQAYMKLKIYITRHRNILRVSENEKKTGKDICILFIEKQNRKKTLLIISLKKGFFKTFSEQNKIKSSIYDEWIGIDIKRCISMQKHLSQRRIGIF